MNNRRAFSLILMLLLLASLTACKRPVPGSGSGPAASDVPETGSAADVSDVLEQIYIFATQTAMATQGLSGEMPPLMETGALEPGQEAPLATGEVASAVPEVQEPPTSTPVPIVIPSATPGLPASYTLDKGEFPYCIARRLNIDPGALLKANNLTTYSVYYGGMTLTIPKNAPKFPGSRALKPHPATYTVRSGDTLGTIACAFGDVDPGMIAYANSFGANAQLSVGQVIQIP